jgi:hypothetical protein
VYGQAIIPNILVDEASYSSSAGLPMLHPLSISTQAEQLIEEDNMLEAFNIIELHCNCLIEHAKQLDKPKYASSHV